MALPHAKRLSKVVNKASTTIAQFDSSLCQVITTVHKFDSESYVEAGKALTDIEYLFQDLQAFYDSFLNCLNNQSETQTSSQSYRSIDNLVYQLEVYIISGFEDKLGGAASKLGAVFGDNVASIITKISSQYVEELTVVKSSLEILSENFETISELGSELTIDIIAAEINVTALNDIITAFKDIVDTSNQVTTITVALVTITTTLDVVTSSISVVETNSTGMISKANYELDRAVQGARKLFTKGILTYQSSIDDAFAEFTLITSMKFTGDADIQVSRGKVDMFQISINQVLETISDSFVTMFKDNLSAMSMQIQTLKDSVTASTQMVTDFLAQVVAMNSGNFVKCFGPSTNNSVIGLQLIQALGQNASTCISAQQNISLESQSLMSFIVEDVLLNVEGAADQMCGCMTKKKRNSDKVKACIMAVIE